MDTAHTIIQLNTLIRTTSIRSDLNANEWLNDCWTYVNSSDRPITSHNTIVMTKFTMLTPTVVHNNLMCLIMQKIDWHPQIQTNTNKLKNYEYNGQTESIQVAKMIRYVHKCNEFMLLKLPVESWSSVLKSPPNRTSIKQTTKPRSSTLTHCSFDRVFSHTVKWHQVLVHLEQYHHVISYGRHVMIRFDWISMHLQAN